MQNAFKFFPRPIRILIYIFLDMISFVAPSILYAEQTFSPVLLMLVIGALVNAAILTTMRQYKQLSIFLSSNMLFRYLRVGILSSLISIGIVNLWLYYFHTPSMLDAKYIILHSLLFVSLGLIWRSLYNILFYKAYNLTAYSRRIIIFGAGKAGKMVEAYLTSSEQFYPVAIVDDDPEKCGGRIGNCDIFHSSKLEALIDDLNANLIVMAIPSLNAKNRATVLHRLENLHAEILLIPELSDTINDSDLIKSFKPIQIEDLLGRDKVLPQRKMMDKSILHKRLLITGAGGSIGSELVRQAINSKPEHIILLEQSEIALYNIEQEITGQLIENKISASFVLGSVTNEKFLTNLMQRYKIDTVFHAAAYKHVPMVERNIACGVFNNVIGTLKCFQCAIDNGVTSFLLISTDKAVRPTNVMGASKRVAEMIVQSIGALNPHISSGIVRFGNVLGSSGSVIPVFEEQINAGGPVTLTHKDITRFFMTIPEAAQLVIQASSMAVSSDLFLLDMGEPVKIRDLAEKLIHLSGNSVKDEGDNINGIEIIETGLRPGEKLYEELLIDSLSYPTSHPKIFRAKEKYIEWPDLQRHLKTISDLIDKGNEVEIRNQLMAIVSGFKPDSMSRSVFEEGKK